MTSIQQLDVVAMSGRGKGTRLLLVQDPRLGLVPVRYRPPADALALGWVWRCAACGTRTRQPACVHTSAAAHALPHESDRKDPR